MNDTVLLRRCFRKSSEASDFSLTVCYRITTALYQFCVEEWMNYFQRLL
jgi:hypothetical protein